MNGSPLPMHRSGAVRIYLTGFMGCGKSTIAPPLSRILGAACFDLDLEIERRAGGTISGIFSREGEGSFRELEREVLFETAAKRSVVVALGGGTIAGEENFAFVKSAGLLVYLRVDFETLFGRLRLKTDRPMLSGGDSAPPTGENLRETMNRLLAEREPFYRRADLIVEPDREDPERSAAAIAALLGRLTPRVVT
jgi:shikimate kinase